MQSLETSTILFGYIIRSTSQFARLPSSHIVLDSARGCDFNQLSSEVMIAANFRVTIVIDRLNESKCYSLTGMVARIQPLSWAKLAIRTLNI